MERRPRSRSLRGPSLAAAFEAARVKVESETESGECTSPSPCSDRRPRAGRLPLRSIVPNPGLTSIKMEVEDAQNESAVSVFGRLCTICDVQQGGSFRCHLCEVLHVVMQQHGPGPTTGSSSLRSLSSRTSSQTRACFISRWRPRMRSQNQRSVSQPKHGPKTSAKPFPHGVFSMCCCRCGCSPCQLLCWIIS
ncbi:rlmI [Symbiodinium sp. CCMP2456]|nr:rlmI [Symbiodinium sp. CCMP2456]